MDILFGLLFSSFYCSSLLQFISHSVYMLTYSLLSVMGYDMSLLLHLFLKMSQAQFSSTYFSKRNNFPFMSK